ncbi:MAG: TIGR02206 family membrane protein [Phycisphaeraceae bacterium]|nr:TIGR02206 family membrane protein [Phycisphaeraceae bacterium]
MCTVIAITGVVWIGWKTARASARPERADPPGRLLGALALAYWIALIAWWLIPSRFDPSRSLPLHYCDVAGLVAAAALLTGRRWVTSLLYFWAIPLCTQAFVTPVVRLGPAFAEFWIFWESHTLIVGSAVYAVVVRGFRPEFRDLRTAWLISVAYAAAIFTLDAFTGWNYAYLGPGAEGAGTLVDVLGPWPARAAVIVLIASAAMVLAWVPWWMFTGPGTPSLER